MEGQGSPCLRPPGPRPPGMPDHFGSGQVNHYVAIEKNDHFWVMTKKTRGGGGDGGHGGVSQLLIYCSR